MTDSLLSSTTNEPSSQKVADVTTVVTTAPQIAIIGGGLTGLFTATLLERAWLEWTQTQTKSKPSLPHITIFEKSRSVGRLATRYRTDSHTNKNWQWAFGAQFFTAKSDSFSQFIAPWLGNGLLQPWCAKVIELTPTNQHTQSPTIKIKEQWDTDHARYISTPKMTRWGRVLADDLRHTTINFKTHVAPLNSAKINAVQAAETSKTELFDEAGESLGKFDWVLCTAPNGQAVELMADSGFCEYAQISKPQMQACYTLMLGWDNAEALPATLNHQLTPVWDVAYLSESILDRVFIEHQKPSGGALLPSVTIHARNDWSEAHVDDDLETIKAQLLQAAQQALHWDDDSTPTQIDCHRWRYAATVTTDKNPLGILIDKQHQWIVSGDWCKQGNIESCYQVAEETVDVIMTASCSP